MSDRRDDVAAGDARAADRADDAVQDVPAGDRVDDAALSAGVDEGRDDALVRGADDLRRRWEAIQVGFVDQPRRAVEQADALVDEVIQGLVDTVGSQRRRLEEQWSGGDEVSTEDLRLALQHYRSFFDRLLRT